MATLKDIAQRAGVTATTVSRVINNRGYISEGTRKKVYAAMEEMHYQPNELARAFSKQYTNTIGLIVPHISHPFFIKVISNLESSAAEKGFKLLLCNSKEQPEKEQDYLDMCISNRVAGIVLCSKYVQTREFRKMNIPVVNLERGGDDDTISVQCDNYQGGKLAAEHLIECGCQHIVCLRGPMKFSSGQQRYQGYEDVCRKYGRKAVWIDCDYDYDAGLAAAEELIRRYPDTDGILASNDMAAMAVYKVLHQNGRRVPEDVQLVGFDNIEFSRRMTPELTTISQPIEEMGKLAVQMIIHHGEEISYQKENIFDVELIRRQTTKKKGEAE